MNDTNCTCECHSDIKQHAEHCDSYSGSFIKTSQSRAWIFHINNTKRSRTTGFVIYSNCPYDYCHTFPLPINLNEPNGADAHCAFNRSSTLCGSCQPGLSLSLGSSLCLSCPDYWPALLIAVTIAGFLAGIAMVVFLLALNMTVAIVKVFTANAAPKPEPKPGNIPPDDDIHRFNELLDMNDRPVNTNDYQAELRQKPVVPTQSVVEVHIPNLAPPDQEANS